MENEKALTVTEEKSLLAQLDGLDLEPAGQENLEAGDTGMPPRLRISQRNRPVEIGDGEAAPGSIVNTLTGEVYDFVEIVPIVFLPRTRVMWPETFSADNAPMCLSDDGRDPSHASDIRKMTNPQAGPCEECPWSKFDDNNPPRCKMQRNFLVWLVEQEEAAIITMQSTALKSARQLTALARTQGLKRSIVFSTREVKSDLGRWHVPAFTKGRRLTIEEILLLVEVRDGLKNLVVVADTSPEMRENEEPVQSPDDSNEDMPF